MSLSLQLFGAPVLLDRGQPVALGRRKAMALLAYLVVTGRPHHRESLAALLWPESNGAAAYSALRNVLWILRQTSLEAHIESDRSTVQINPSVGLEVDVLRFRQGLEACPSGTHDRAIVCEVCEPGLRVAADLWVGPFMDGFSVANSGVFEDWQLAEGEALRREHVETLDRLYDAEMIAKRWSAAANLARRRLQADPLNELGFRALMRALSAEGKRSEALRVYNECSRILHEEMGLEPERETRELADRVRASRQNRSAVSENRAFRLPPSPHPFVGRGDLADRLSARLLERASPVTTLVGLGGAGKTSLALHVGRCMKSEFSHGIVFVALDSARGPHRVCSAVAQTLGISLVRERGSELIQQLADYLQERELLLILDGAEHVLRQVAKLCAGLRHIAGLRVLVTSRISLDIEGETVLPLHGLDTPSAATPPEKLAGYPSIRLLQLSAERGGEWSPPSPQEFAAMGRLARLLEGSPLGLEMAAGWRSVLSWEEIVERVSGNLEFLVATRHDVPAKHRTFAAVFEQAWDLLPDEAREALRALSVFRNGFTILAAEAVTRCHPGILALLVNRCLVRRIASDRYDMHELLRQFASAKLGASGRVAEMIRKRHAEFYADGMELWFSKLKGRTQFSTLAAIEVEIDNIRAAFQYAAETGLAEALERSCEGLFFYYDMRTLFEEAETVFLQAVEAYRAQSSDRSSIEAFLEIAAGWCVANQRPDVAEVRLSKGLELLGEGAPKDRLHAMANVICAYANVGRDQEALAARISESVRFYRECGDLWGEGLALGAWAVQLSKLGDGDAAEKLAYRSLHAHREIGDAWGEGLALMFLARLAERRGELELALARYEESQRLSEPIASDIVGVIDSITSQARVSLALGNAEQADVLATRALELSRGVGNRLFTGGALVELAQAHRALGKTESAKRLLEEAFQMLSYRLWRRYQATCARRLADLAISEADIGRAEQWLREACALDPQHPDLSEIRERVTSVKRRGRV